MLAPSTLRSVLQPIENAVPFPREAYTNEAIFSWEIEQLFGHAALGATADLPRPGSWRRVPFAHDHLVLARTAELSLRAFRALCKHRGVLLFEEAQGHAPSLCVECPYHGWTYALSGALLQAPGMSETFDRKKHGLDSFPTELLLEQCFVHTHGTKEARTLPPWLQQLPLLRRARSVQWKVDANWKFLIENFQESHHFLRVHPGLQRWTPFAQSSSITTHAHEGWLGGTMQLIDRIETVSRSGKRLDRPWIVPETQRRTVYDAYVFPNVLTSLQPDYLLVYRLYPQHPSHTLVEGDIYVHPQARAESLEELYAFWDQTNDEDRRICERQQSGTQSKHWNACCYAPSEDGMLAFDQLIARRLLAVHPERGVL